MGRGERIALEVELSRKGFRRLEDKIRLYDRLLMPNEGIFFSPKVLDKVWIVVTKNSVYRAYRKALFSVRCNRFLFRIDFYDDVIPACARDDKTSKGGKHEPI